MCTPWTIPRLVRWRVRDWASCFLACKFPLDDEPQLPIQNRRAVDESSKKMSRHKRRNKQRQPKQSSTQPKDANIPVENGPDDSRWPHYSDEDYIVFCFREDGAFDVVKETSRSISRPVNRKLNYGEEAKTVVERYSNEEKDEEESIYYDTEAPANGMRRRYQIDHEVEDRGLVSVGSSGSNQSDGSSGSFAFPVLGWEWMGSPVQMPKSEGLQLRKHKARCVGFQCFRI
ncbi:hypothetical protein SLA2020_277930 [Shorea laevis]